MKKILSIAIVVLVIGGCTKDPKVENTSTVEMAGEWWVRIYHNNALAYPDYYKTVTYNTASPNSGQVWVDDEGFWPLKAKFDVDYANLTFKSMASTPNTALTNRTVKVIEGKILKGVGKSITGNVVDSIYMKLEFSDDPGNEYEVKGHYDTGFFADHP